MTSEEILKKAIEERIYIHDVSWSGDKYVSWSGDKLCNMLVDEIKRLKMELEKAKSYDYRAYAPNVWIKEGE